MSIDKYLQEIQKERIQEIEPVTLISLGVGAILVVKQIVMFFVAASLARSQAKVETKLSKKINTILETDNKYIVYKTEDLVPNAYATGGNDIFITKGLTKLLSEKEVDAVILHEVYHNKAKHIQKELAVKSPFYFLIGTVSATAALTALPILGFLMYFISTNVLSVSLRRIMGRRQEVNADEYAVKYGYGNELISALNKIEVLIKRFESTQQCDGVCQLVRKIDETLDEHPPFKKRVELILKNSNKLKNAISSRSFKKIKDLVVSAFK